MDSKGQVPEKPTWQHLGVVIKPQGRAFYDHVPVGEAGFRQFQTTIAWPVGADVCQRSQGLKEVLTATLQTLFCENVTWAELANLRHLEVNVNTNIVSSRKYLTKDLESFLPFDLMGLTGLRSLAVTHELYSLGDIPYTHWPVQFPPLFWSQVPQLEDLTFRNVALNQVSDDLLVHTPALQSLDLTLAQVTQLPTGFLAFTPQLQSLTLDLGQNLTQLPAGFLAQTPRLQHLSLNVSGAVLALLPSHLFTAAPHLEALHLRVSGAGTMHLPPGFLQYTPQLKEVVLWLDTPRKAPAAGLLVLAEPASFLSHAPKLQNLWLHRVDVGTDFLDGLPATTRIHWVPRDSAPFPPVSHLATAAHQSWLHVNAEEAIPLAYPPAHIPLNLELTSSNPSQVSDPMIAWLSHRKLDAFTLDLEETEGRVSEGALKLLEALGRAQQDHSPQRVSLLMNRSAQVPLPRGLLAGQAYDWLYLKHLAIRSLPPDFFADFTTTALLLEPGYENAWSFPEQQPALRHLLQSPQTRHLGLILRMTGARTWSFQTLPPGVLGDLDFACLELDLIPTQPGPMYEALLALLAEPSMSVTWQAREERSVSTSYWPPWTERRQRLTQPTWFEASHIPWAQEKGCRRSLYLRMQGPEVALSPQVLEPLGELRHIRLTYSPADCRKCPAPPTGALLLKDPHDPAGE